MNTGEMFKGKKVTLMGLGLLGGLVNDAIFLLGHGAELTVTDIKSEDQLRPSVEKLKSFDNVTFVFGEHRLEDFRDRDFILQSGNVPMNSIYLAEARKNNIPVHVSESLFAEYVDPGVVLVGITGTRGKSTVTQFVFEALEHVDKTVYLAGNVRGVSTLALLDTVTPGDIVVMELDSWALHGMGEIGVSPHVAIFTTMFPDHMNFYKDDMDAYITDKAQIFLHQKPDDIFVLGEQALPYVQRLFPEHVERASIVDSSPNVEKWNLKLIGKHNLYNASLAFDALRRMGIETETIKEAFEAMDPVEGRLEMVREMAGVKIYNDTNSTTPEATIAGINSFPKAKSIILILGGADKGLQLDGLIQTVAEKVRKAILIPGKGTDRFIAEGAREKGVKYFQAHDVKDAVSEAVAIATTGDVILFSPGFSSFSQFSNEYERGDEFKRVVSELKE